MFWPRRRWGRWRHRYCPILPARRACLPRGSPRREAVTASISAGSSLRGTQPARRCRALRTPAGAMWTCRMTGASRGRLIRTRRAAGRHHTCPRGSGGIGRSFACLPRTGTELRCWSSTACIRTAKFGSTASIWVCAPQNAPSSGSGAYLPTGIGWYRKKFRVPAEDRDRVAVLEFDGVYQNSEVWINGQYLGLRPYGYVAFSYDLTPHLIAGRDNVIAVKVDNSRQSNCRWYSGSGIYRHTWLLATNHLHVAYWGTFVTSPRVSKDASTVQIKTRVRHDGKTAAPCTL